MADVRPLGNGRFVVEHEGTRRVAYAVSRGGESWVFLGGDVFVIGASKGQARRSGGHDEAALAAPMPATVVSIDVAAGDRVGTGDTLLVLEAMKMELSIKAPRDARITRIACHVGELVQPGLPLVELE